MTVRITPVTVAGCHDVEEVARTGRPLPLDARSVTLTSSRTAVPARRSRWRRAGRVLLVVVTIAVVVVLVAGGGARLGRIADEAGVHLARSSASTDVALVRRAVASSEQSRVTPPRGPRTVPPDGR